MSESDIALGVKVFYRTEKLGDLLESAKGHDFATVYVADDGNTSERQHLYDREYPFDLRVIDLEYDAGAGYGRSRIVDELEEDYMLLLDSDHEVLDVEPLYEQLTARDDLGAVAGLMYKRDGEIQANCHDFYEHGDVLVRDVRGEKPIETVAGRPHVRFDFVPAAALFRRECLEEYSWDPEYVIGKDHLDLYYGHWKHTDWKFGVYPGVTTIHNPGGDRGYLSNRLDTRKTWHGKKYFLEKWGYDQLVYRRHWSAMSTNDHSPGGLAGSSASRLGVSGISIDRQAQLLDLHDVGMRLKGKLFRFLS